MIIKTSKVLRHIGTVLKIKGEFLNPRRRFTDCFLGFLRILQKIIGSIVNNDDADSINN